jgi:hypothetical protein
MLVADQPENLTLYGYNLNDRLNDTEIFQLRAFDLIHSRFVAPGIRRRRWSSYLREIRLLLRSGGWLQVIEYHLHIQSDSGRLTDQSAVYRWWQGYVSAMSGLDRDPRIGQRLESLLEAERFRDVHVEYKMLPIGAWSAGMWVFSHLLFASIATSRAALLMEACQQHWLGPSFQFCVSRLTVLQIQFKHRLVRKRSPWLVTFLNQWVYGLSRLGSVGLLHSLTHSSSRSGRNCKTEN